MSSADPFFENYETAKRIGSGAFANVLLVRRKKSSSYFAAKFLDPLARKFGSSSQELQSLKSLNHECVIKLTEVYEPYQPATSRRLLDPSMPYLKSRERKERVLVFPAYDMDLKWLMRLRKECPEGLMKASLSSHGGPCCYWGRGPWGDGFQLRRGRGSYSPRVHGWLCATRSTPRAAKSR